MADYSSIDYSGGFSNPSDVFENPSSVGGFDWGGTETPFNNTYTPSIQQPPAQTNWLDVVRGLGVAFDAAGNAVRAFRGTPPNRGGPYDQWMQAETRKEQDRSDRELLSSLLDRYSKTDEEDKKTDPENLLERYRVLDPTRRMEVAGITDSRDTDRASWASLPRLAGDIFSGSYRNSF